MKNKNMKMELLHLKIKKMPKQLQTILISEIFLMQFIKINYGNIRRIKRKIQ